MRMDMMTFCRSVEIEASCAAALLKLSRFSPGTFKSELCSTTDSEITSSPIRSISWSILLTLTLINAAFSPLGLSLASFFCLPGSLDWMTKSPGVILGVSGFFASALASSACFASCLASMTSTLDSRSIWGWGCVSPKSKPSRN